LVIRPEPLRALPRRVDDRRPGPAELTDERARAVERVRDVEPEELQLRVILDELRVGTRLAAADQSPRRPDVDDDGLAPQRGERGAFAVERDALDAGRLACGGLRRKLGGLVPAAAGEPEGGGEN
jgi:hypothetical protein